MGDELSELRRFLGELKSGSMKIHENKKDVTARELERMKSDIEHLETVRARSREWGSDAQNSPGRT